MAQTSAGLNNPIGAGAGVTNYYAVTYDDSLSSADGVERANALIASCDGDFAIMAGWFAGTSLRGTLPITVQIATGSFGSASWNGGNTVNVTLIPGNGSSAGVLRYLLVAEMTEVFMWSKNNGWGYDDGDTVDGVKGEGLSRFLGYQFIVESDLDPAILSRGGINFFVADYWLQQENQVTGQLDRVDYLGPDPDDNKPDALTGCATLFLYYLNVQLGYGIRDIIDAGAATLKAVYRNLTGRSEDPFPAFSGMLATAYPNGATINSGVNRDNPYPIFQQMQINCVVKPGSVTEHIGAVGGINHTTGAPFHILQPDCIAMIVNGALGVIVSDPTHRYRFYVDVDGQTADVGVFYHYVPGPDGLRETSYIATTPDRTKVDNLLSLPSC